MDRKEFLRNTCKLGLCACAGMLFSNKGYTAEKEANCKSLVDETEKGWKKYYQDRYFRFVDVIDANVDDKLRNKMFEEFGRACSDASLSLYENFIGNLEGFLKHAEENWADKAVYNKEKNEIEITGKQAEECGCPFVNTEKMTPDYCQCSLGWRKHTFEKVTGKNVDVEMTSSVLRGGNRCSCKISILT